MTSRGRVAVVTGGTAGVGRATVRELVRHGYDIGVVARGEEGLDATMAEVREAGCRALGLSVDVADAAAVERAADRFEAELGPIDVWVNNAFVGSIAFFDAVRPEEFQRITEVTYLGQVNGTRAALKYMTQRNRGSIVQVSSALAYQGIPLQSAYCGAKHAVVGFSESVRVELKHRGSKVRLSLVALPAVNTPQFDWVLHRGIRHHPQPVPPIYQPEVAARAVVHVAEHPRRSLWVGGSTVATILGNRLAPALVEWYLARTNVRAQQAPEHDPPGDRTNIWHAVPEDPGAHGVFGEVSHRHSATLALSLHRRALAVGAAGAVSAVAGVAGAAAGRRHRRPHYQRMARH